MCYGISNEHEGIHDRVLQNRNAYPPGSKGWEHRIRKNITLGVRAMTAINIPIDLRRRLAQAYPNQARNLTSGPILIRIDDRDSDDSYPGFCDIHLKMSAPDADQFTLTLDNVPYDDDVKAVAEELEGTWQSTHTGERLTLSLSASQTADLRRLATGIRKVVGRGKSYLDRNWKWIAPRTAKSLEQLAREISKGT